MKKKMNYIMLLEKQRGNKTFKKFAKYVSLASKNRIDFKEREGMQLENIS